MKNKVINEDPYEILGVSSSTPLEKIKVAYRVLAKKHHPDKGGDKDKIIAINAAWELLSNRATNNKNINKNQKIYNDNHNDFKAPDNKGSDKDKAISYWLRTVYQPIDRLIAEIINPFPKRFKELSADPYDDELMEAFCKYIKTSQKKIKKAQELYQAIQTPTQIRQFSLCLYQCFSEIQDGINEWEIYTSGYVESYLHDGKEMLRKAKKKRLVLQKEKHHLLVL